MQRWGRVIRLVGTLAVFGGTWLLLSGLGSVLLDTERIRKELSDSDMLRFLAPGLRYQLLNAWQPIGALVIAWLAHRNLGRVSVTIARRLFAEKPEFKLSPIAEKVLACFWKESLLRKEEKIATELGIPPDDVRAALEELNAYGLVRQRVRPKGIFWDKTGKGKRYLDDR